MSSKIVLSLVCLVVCSQVGEAFGSYAYCSNGVVCYSSSFSGVYCCGTSNDSCCSLFELWWFWLIWGFLFFVACGCSYERRRRRRLRMRHTPVILANNEIPHNYPIIITPTTPYNYAPQQFPGGYGSTSHSSEPPAYSTLQNKPYQQYNTNN